MGKIDGHQVQALQFPAERAQPEGRMMGVGLQQQQGLAILLALLWVAFQEPGCAPVVLVGEDQRPDHSFASRFMCASTDSFTKRPAAISAWLSANAAVNSHSRKYW